MKTSEVAQDLKQETELLTGANTRLLIGPWENAAGRMLVTVAPQYKDRGGQWRLAHSGLMLAPDIARELGPVLVAAAAAIEAVAPEPAPTENEAMPSEGRQP